MALVCYRSNICTLKEEEMKKEKITELTVAKTNATRSFIQSISEHARIITYKSTFPQGCSLKCVTRVVSGQNNVM